MKRPHERTIARLATGETIDITDVDVSAPLAVVMAGRDPAIHSRQSSSVVSMDHRAKPGDDISLASQIVAERKVKSHKVEHYLLSGEEVLEGPTQWPGRYIPIFPVIGSETALETKVIRNGLILHPRSAAAL